MTLLVKRQTNRLKPGLQTFGVTARATASSINLFQFDPLAFALIASLRPLPRKLSGLNSEAPKWSEGEIKLKKTAKSRRKEHGNKGKSMQIKEKQGKSRLFKHFASYGGEFWTEANEFGQGEVRQGTLSLALSSSQARVFSICAGQDALPKCVIG